MNARALTLVALLAALNAGVHAAPTVPKAKTAPSLTPRHSLLPDIPSVPPPRSLMPDMAHMPEGDITVRGMTTMPPTYFVYGTRGGSPPSNLADTVSGRHDIHPSYGVDQYGNLLPAGQIGPRFVPKHAAPAPAARPHRKP